MLSHTFRKEHPLWYEHSIACLLLGMKDSVRAFQNDEIEAQAGNFRSRTGKIHPSKNFRKVSMDFWTLCLRDLTRLSHVWCKVELSPIPNLAEGHNITDKVLP
jgi:hypothetical protein